MLIKIKKWFGFPLVTEYQKEIEKVLEERLNDLEMTENNKKAPAKGTSQEGTSQEGTSQEKSFK